MRNFKTGLAVFICLLAYNLIGRDGYDLACYAAIIAMQATVEKTVNSGLSRIIGTVVGAMLGMGLSYLNQAVPGLDLVPVTATVGVMAVILFCNVIDHPNSIVIACVVLLVIVLDTSGRSPLLYSVNRLIDTLAGIMVAFLVNRFIRNPDARPIEPPAEADGDPNTEKTAEHTEKT